MTRLNRTFSVNKVKRPKFSGMLRLPRLSISSPWINAGKTFFFIIIHFWIVTFSALAIRIGNSFLPCFIFQIFNFNHSELLSPDKKKFKIFFVIFGLEK